MLTAQQLLIILDAVAHHALPESKLLPLLVGMPNSVFVQVLHQANPEVLNFLKLEGVIEPIQHHLTLLADTVEKQDNEIGTSLMIMGQEISQLDVSTIRRSDLQKMRKQLETKREYYLNTIALASKALAIAWNTNRLDLIEQFTKIKERCLSALHDFIGTPGKDDNPGTGMYGLLEQTLSAVYSESPELKDSDPATEALAQFSIWYLRDYWSLGLLPSIKHEEDLELNTEDELAKRDHRQKLFAAVQESLNRLGIGTVGDLKKVEIFSKNLLEDHIDAFRDKL